MSKQQDLDILWRKICQVDKEMAIEAKDMARIRQGVSQRYNTLKQDMVKLKYEYEKLKGGGEYNPMSLSQGERQTSKTVLDKWFGKRGPDTHSKLED